MVRRNKGENREWARAAEKIEEGARVGTGRRENSGKCQSGDG